MQKKFWFLIALCCTASFLVAQKPSIRYSGNLSAGLLIGAKDNNIQVQVVNGVQYQTWSAGLGVGLDDYPARSVPLFLQVRKAVFSKPETPYFYVDGGYHFPFLKEEEKTFVEKQKGGFYGEGGLGYDMRVLKKHGLFFGLGWRVKTYTLKVNTMPYLSVWPTPESAYSNFHYTLSSLAFKVGFRF